VGRLSRAAAREAGTFVVKRVMEFSGKKSAALRAGGGWGGAPPKEKKLGNMFLKG